MACTASQTSLITAASTAHTADHSTVKAAYLLDPVDELSSSSAVQQLAGQGLAVGVTAAGVTGAFNPEHSDYRVSTRVGKI
jgi:hypothetical protein